MSLNFKYKPQNIEPWRLYDFMDFRQTDKTVKTFEEIFLDCLCVMTSHSKDKEMQSATKPQTKFISVLACGLLTFLASKWLFSCNTIN